MNLFEILFIALFILFPIVEQVLKKKRAPGPTQQEPEDRALEDEVPERLERPGQVEVPAGRDPGSASDMVPDDLWAVLTGEQREPRVEEVPAPDPSAWEDEERTPAWGEARREVKRRRARQNAPWSIDDDQEAAPVPESLEEYGPEAYSLEQVDLEPVSLEQPIPSTEIRHRQFHERVDRLPPRRKVRRSRVSRALRDSDSLRQALILNEVLGTPKGLD